MVVKGIVVLLGLAHLPDNQGTYEDYLGKRKEMADRQRVVRGKNCSYCQWL